MLTASEARTAAARAREYPPGCGLLLAAASGPDGPRRPERECEVIIDASHLLDALDGPDALFL